MRPGAITTSVKIPTDLLRGFGIQRLVQRHDPAKGRGTVAIKRGLVGLKQRRARGHATRVGVFDDGTGRAFRRVEFATSSNAASVSLMLL